MSFHMCYLLHRSKPSSAKPSSSMPSWPLGGSKDAVTVAVTQVIEGATISEFQAEYDVNAAALTETALLAMNLDYATSEKLSALVTSPERGSRRLQDRNTAELKTMHLPRTTTMNAASTAATTPSMLASYTVSFYATKGYGEAAAKDLQSSLQVAISSGT